MIEATTEPGHEPAFPTRAEHGCVVAVLSGAIDTTRVPALREHLLRLLRPASRLVLDLSLVSDVDTGVLAVIVGTGRRARMLGGSLRLAAVTPCVATALRAADLDRQLDIFPTVRSAVYAPALI